MILALAFLAGAASAVPDLPVVKLTPGGPGAMDGVVVDEPAAKKRVVAKPVIAKPTPVIAKLKPAPKPVPVAMAKPAVATPIIVALVKPAAEAPALRLGPSGLAPGERGPELPDPISLSLVALRKSGAWPKAVELTPDGTLAMTSDFSSNTLTLVSTTSLDVIGTVRMGGDSPVEIAFLPGGASAVITGGYEHDRTFVFDVATRAVRRVIEGAKNRKFPKVPVVTPDGAELWISYWASNTVGVFDALSFEPKATIAVGRNPRGIAFTPDGKKAYVCNFCNACSAASTVHVIDTATRKRTAVISGLKQPRHAVVSPDGSAVYVSVLGDQKVVKIDTSTDKVVASVRVGNRPKTIELTPDGRFLFVANYGADSLMAVDTTLMQVVATVKAGHEPSGLSVSADGRRLWTTDWSDGTIRIFDIGYPVEVEGPPLPEVASGVPGGP